MASKRVSPSAQLLRRSRLFSLPPPLRRPLKDQHEATSTFESDTATIHYPIYATIETTPSSRSRGDWGLKRPLPLKSTTNTSTPLVRVKEVDNIDHITNYESAADHTLTLQKWQEMNIPIRRNSGREVTDFFLSDDTSVFDGFIDGYHNPPEVSQKLGQKDKRRWRFKGPWLAGMDNVEFERYLKTQIKKRRPEFRQYLRSEILKRRVENSRGSAMNKGEDIDAAKVTLTEEEFQEEIIRLRHDVNELWRILWNFLDLPGRAPRGNLVNPEQDKGPPVTHPSAGLSYLRTSSHIFNHPLLGPQERGPPVKGRVLQSGLVDGKVSRGGALFGLGGVVARGASNETGMTPFETRGGERGWLNPRTATIDSFGRIILMASKAQKEEIAVWENEFEPTSARAKEETQDIGNLLGVGGGAINQTDGRTRSESIFKSDPLLKRPSR